MQTTEVSPELQAISNRAYLYAYSSNTKLMIANDLNRHSRGDRHVKLNADGTVTLRQSSDTKGKAEDTNFLPVPTRTSTYCSACTAATSKFRLASSQCQSCRRW